VFANRKGIRSDPLTQRNHFQAAVDFGTARVSLTSSLNSSGCSCSGSGGDAHTRRRALNPRRIERYLLTARSSRIPALVLVNKADVVSESEAREALQQLAPLRARVLLVSARSGLGLAELGAELLPSSSAVLLGSSGVGKSTLVNALLGDERQRTSAERSDDSRGRHTTTERQLLRLASGALLIDTPGMRELGLWADDETDTDDAFDDIAELAAACRFRDCGHESEPGCAVQAALHDGTLSAERLEHARKLERELAHQRSRMDVRLRQAQAERRKSISRANRARQKHQGSR